MFYVIFYKFCNDLIIVVSMKVVAKTNIVAHLEEASSDI